MGSRFSSEKNYDWMVEDGLVIVNKRGLSKIANKSVVDNTGLGIPATLDLQIRQRYVRSIWT